jgi:hypothetical protein
MKKLFFICYKKTKNILVDEKQCSQIFFNVLSKLLSEENITTYCIYDEHIKRNFSAKILGFFWTIWTYFFEIIAKKLRQSSYKGQIITFFHNVEKVYFE